jgi:uncharacterized membrane protein
MPKVEISKIIKAPRAKVWEAISDPETMPKWDVNTKSAKVLSREGNTVIMTHITVTGGTEAEIKERWTYYPQERIETETLEGSQVDVGGTEAEIKERWTYYPQERIETETLEGSQVDVKGFQLYEEVPDGTKVTLSYDIGFKGIVGQTLGRLLAGPKLRAFIEETIEGMAKYSEAL